MKKYLVPLSVILLLILLVVVFIYARNDDGDTLETTKNEITEEIEEIEDDQEVEETEEDEADEVVFDYKADLEDVTEGLTILGVNTGGNSSGVAESLFDGKYMLRASFSELPDPIGTDFYEGWVVRNEPFNFVSTGVVEKVDGVYVNTFESETDLIDHDFYVLTLEPDDGDPAPAGHIVEGTLVEVN